MITNFFIPELNNHDVQELWFQQDGATCHTARATIDLLKDTLGDRLISRFGPVDWPPRSCDLTPLDYFLWGYVKSLVYADKPQTLDHLEDNIRRVIADSLSHFNIDINGIIIITFCILIFLFDLLLMPHFRATQELLAINLVILNSCQMTRTIPEQAAHYSNS
ncbi:uncharacterized protein TNCV_2890251 [Trichonephila clavipes]|nr:uncharacterized protein TNCV_2890251 [Trichonephila clavipes]